MSHYVQTTDGTLLDGNPNDPDHPSKNLEITEDQANARCKKANAEAEALGIKARYEVKEAA